MIMQINVALIIRAWIQGLTHTPGLIISIVEAQQVLTILWQKKRALLLQSLQNPEFEAHKRVLMKHSNKKLMKNRSQVSSLHIHTELGKEY
jgi:hypothetical protein